MLPLPEGLGSIPGQGTRIPQVLWYSQKKSIKTFLPFLATYIWDWRKKWQPTPVFLPGKPYGQRSLVGYSPQGHKESDMTEHAHSLIYGAGYALYTINKTTSCNRLNVEADICPDSEKLWKNCK